MTAQRKARQLPRGSWLQVAIAMPIVAGVAHIVTTFVAANDLRGSAYARVSATLPMNTMKVIDDVAPNRQPLPYLSADARYAMCAFSTRSGPVKASAVLPEAGWTLGVFRPDGSSAYFAAGQPARETPVEITIVPDDDRFLGMTPQALGQSIDVSPQLKVSAKEGVIVVRAPDSGFATEGEAETYLAKAACRSAAY